MNINAFSEVMSACRFCFMCRHLSAVGIVSCREADTPRGRALIADTVRLHPEKLADADFIETIYRSDLSGANRFHCDSYHDGKGYDEIGLQLALRRDIVAAGVVPETVRKVAKELEDSAHWQLEGRADTLYFLDPATAGRPAVGAAVARVLGQAGIPFATLKGGCIGKALAVLGYEKEAKKAMRSFAEAVKASGAKTLIVSNPAAAEALLRDFPAAGIELGVEVRFAAGYFAELAKAGRIRFRGTFGKASYLPSDYLKNYLKCGCAEELLAQLGVENLPFGTNAEESYTAAEGALVLNRLHPELVRAMAERIAGLAESGVKLLVASAHTADALAAAGADAMTLEEAAEAALC